MLNMTSLRVLHPRAGVYARRVVSTAVLSRQTAGLRGKALILNLPGKPRAIRETIDEVRLANSVYF